MIKYVLKSIENKAGAVWQVQSMALPKKEAEKLLKRRLSAKDKSHRYGLFPS
jgi:hypothetical protein